MMLVVDESARYILTRYKNSIDVIKLTGGIAGARHYTLVVYEVTRKTKRRQDRNPAAVGLGADDAPYRETTTGPLMSALACNSS